MCTMEKKIKIIKLCLLFVLVLSAAVIALRAYDGWRAEQDSGDAAQIAKSPEPEKADRVRPALPEPVPDDEPEEPVEEEPLPEEAAALIEINLDALRETNADVVGWIEIPGTELSYPLMQGTDNQYYLSHNWKGEANSAGSVFLESTSSRDLTDFHTLAYAHRMRNGTMFGTLKYYKGLDFWQEHPNVYLVMDDGIYRYAIFAAHEASVKGIVYRLDIEKQQLEEEFLQYCLDSSVIDTGITPEADDRILTLSTCTGNGHANRWVVHGVLEQKYSGNFN